MLLHLYAVQLLQPLQDDLRTHTQAGGHGTGRLCLPPSPKQPADVAQGMPYIPALGLKQPCSNTLSCSSVLSGLQVPEDKPATPWRRPCRPAAGSHTPGSCYPSHLFAGLFKLAAEDELIQDEVHLRGQGTWSQRATNGRGREVRPGAVLACTRKARNATTQGRARNSNT